MSNVPRQKICDALLEAIDAAQDKDALGAYVHIGSAQALAQLAIAETLERLEATIRAAQPPTILAAAADAISAFQSGRVIIQHEDDEKP